MKRSSSWRNLQRTFASTPISTVKRAKNNRNVDNSRRSHDGNVNLQIEDSDEENVNRVKRSVRVQQKTPKPVQTKSKPKSRPLLINTSLNSSKLQCSYVLNSDTDESVDDEPVLNDVADSMSYKCQKKARSKSLLFVSKSEQNQLNASNQRNDGTPDKQQKSHHKPVFGNTFSSRPENNKTVIESDSFDENESPIKSSEHLRVETITRQHSADIIFTQSNENSNPVIESEFSSQFSPKFESPIFRNHGKRLRGKKQVKGGLVEQLNKLLKSDKSEYSYWMNERTSDLIESGEKMRINRMEQSYGRILLYCSSVDGKNVSSIVNILCVDPSFKRLAMLQTGKTIEVCLDSNGYSIGNNTFFYPKVMKILV